MVQRNDDGTYTDTFGEKHSSQAEAEKVNEKHSFGSNFAKASNDAWADSANKLRAYHEKMDARELEVLKEVGRTLETKEKHGKECTDACNQIFDLYKSGKIAEAISYCKQSISQLSKNQYVSVLPRLAAAMLYNEGKYKEAIECNEPFVSSLCYEKLGQKKEATEMAIKAMPDLFHHNGIYYWDPHTSFLTTGDDHFSYEETPFDISFTEFAPLVKERAEAGN